MKCYIYSKGYQKKMSHAVLPEMIMNIVNDRVLIHINRRKIIPQRGKINEVEVTRSTKILQ